MILETGRAGIDLSEILRADANEDGTIRWQDVHLAEIWQLRIGNQIRFHHALGHALSLAAVTALIGAFGHLSRKLHIHRAYIPLHPSHRQD